MFGKKTKQKKINDAQAEPTSRYESAGVDGLAIRTMASDIAAIASGKNPSVIGATVAGESKGLAENSPFLGGAQSGNQSAPNVSATGTPTSTQQLPNSAEIKGENSTSKELGKNSDPAEAVSSSDAKEVPSATQTPKEGTPSDIPMGNAAGPISHNNSIQNTILTQKPLQDKSIPAPADPRFDDGEVPPTPPQSEPTKVATTPGASLGDEVAAVGISLGQHESVAPTSPDAENDEEIGGSKPLQIFSPTAKRDKYTRGIPENGAAVKSEITADRQSNAPKESSSIREKQKAAFPDNADVDHVSSLKRTVLKGIAALSVVAFLGGGGFYIWSQYFMEAPVPIQPPQPPIPIVPVEPEPVVFDGTTMNEYTMEQGMSFSEVLLEIADIGADSGEGVYVVDIIDDMTREKFDLSLALPQLFELINSEQTTPATVQWSLILVQEAVGHHFGVVVAGEGVDLQALMNKAGEVEGADMISPLYPESISLPQTYAFKDSTYRDWAIRYMNFDENEEYSMDYTVRSEGDMVLSTSKESMRAIIDFMILKSDGDMTSIDGDDKAALAKGSCEEFSANLTSCTPMECAEVDEASGVVVEREITVGAEGRCVVRENTTLAAEYLSNMECVFTEEEGEQAVSELAARRQVVDADGYIVMPQVGECVVQ